MKKCLILAVLMAFAAGAGAQETEGVVAPESRKGTVLKGRAPVAKDVLQVTFPKPKAFTLANGLKVFVLEDRRLPTIRMTMLLKAGSLYETKPGVAELTGAMLDEGTRTRTVRALAIEVEEMGATLNTGAGSELATVSIAGLSDFTDRYIALLTDVLLRPSFPRERLDQITFQRIAALAQRKASPDRLVSELSGRLFYGDTPYARASETEAELRAVAPDDLRAFHDALYRPNGAILSITGDVDAPAIVARFERALAEWRPGARTPELPKATFTGPAMAGIHLIDRPGSAQTTLEFGTPAISRTDPDYVPLLVADRILGGGSTGRLFQNLRENKGYTYGAYSSLSTPRWTGIWGASASVRTPVTEPAVGAFFTEFARLQNEPVSPAELEQAQRSLIGGFARTLESPDGIQGRTLELVQNGLPLDYWDTYPARIQAVTAADIQRVARKYLGAGRVQLIAVGEREAIEPGLRKYGPVTVYDREGKPLGK